VLLDGVEKTTNTGSRVDVCVDAQLAVIDLQLFFVEIVLILLVLVVTIASTVHTHLVRRRRDCSTDWLFVSDAPYCQTILDHTLVLPIRTIRVAVLVNRRRFLFDFRHHAAQYSLNSTGPVSS